MTSVSYENPGMLLESVRNEFLSYLEQNKEIEIVSIEDFRDANLISNQVYFESISSKELDAFIWFGEIGRDYRRDYNLSLLKIISQSAKVINNPVGYEIAMDKYLTSSFLDRHGIPVPRFALITSENAEKTIEKIAAWNSPALIKPRLGSHGIGIVKIDRIAEIINFIDYRPNSVHFVEEFIQNDFNKWIGINIIGGEHAYSYSKEHEALHDGWKVMDRQCIGGKMIMIQPNEDQIMIAKKIAELLGMDWVGVDMVTDSSGKSYVIDVNAFPGLYPEMSEKAKVNCPKMMADAVFRRLGV